MLILFVQDVAMLIHADDRLPQTSVLCIGQSHFASKYGVSWLLIRPVINLDLHCSDKTSTACENFRHRFYELCDHFKNYYRIFTDGSKEGNRVAAAVVHRDNTKCVRLPDMASIFRAELYVLLLAIDVVRHSKEKNFGMVY